MACLVTFFASAGVVKNELYMDVVFCCYFFQIPSLAMALFSVFVTSAGVVYNEPCVHHLPVSCNAFVRPVLIRLP